MEIRIRRGRRTDYAALAALGAWPSVEGSPARAVRLYRRVAADLAYDLYVAEATEATEIAEDTEAGERLVGLVAVSYVRALALAGQRATIEQLIVHPDCRGRGVGRRLLEFVLRRAERRGACAIEARPEDDIAERFLDHLGFRPRGLGYE